MTSKYLPSTRTWRTTNKQLSGEIA